MPTFKYTLSEDEIWAIVGYVRTLHGMKLEFNVEERKKQLTDAVKTAQEKFEQAKQAYEAAEKRASEEAEKKSAALKKDVDVDESAYAKEQAAMAQAKKELDAAQATLAYFSTRPGKGLNVARPDLTLKPEQSTALAEVGKRLYANKYGCNGCHSLAGRGRKSGTGAGSSGLPSQWHVDLSLGEESPGYEARNQNAGIGFERCRCEGRDDVPGNAQGAKG